MPENKTTIPLSIILDGKEYAIKQDLTVDEKYTFIRRVVSESIVNISEYSRLHRDIAFDVTFLDICTDFEVPMIEEDGKLVIDTQQVVDIIAQSGEIIKNFNLKYMSDLRACVTDAIDFEKQKVLAIYSSSNATDDAINTVSALAYKLIELAEKAIVWVDKNGEKLTKILSKKRINELISSIQNTGKLIAQEAEARSVDPKQQLTLLKNDDE